jgi:hypothetical protein
MYQPVHLHQKVFSDSSDPEIVLILMIKTQCQSYYVDNITCIETEIYGKLEDKSLHMPKNLSNNDR